MDLDLQKYYEARADMMASQGWKDLITDVQTMLKATDNLSGVTVENLRFKQGEISIMQWLLNLETASNEAFTQLKEEDNEDTSGFLMRGLRELTRKVSGH